MAILDLIYQITGPQWLVTRINMIALLIAASCLVYFGSVVHGKIILPIADWVRGRTHAKVSKMERVSSNWSNFIATSLATIVFLLYVWFGAIILADYIFAPILFNLRNFILIVAIIVFLIISYAINNIKLRKQFMGT